MPILPFIGFGAQLFKKSKYGSMLIKKYKVLFLFFLKISYYIYTSFVIYFYLNKSYFINALFYCGSNSKLFLN